MALNTKNQIKSLLILGAVVVSKDCVAIMCGVFFMCGFLGSFCFFCFCFLIIVSLNFYWNLLLFILNYTYQPNFFICLSLSGNQIYF